LERPDQSYRTIIHTLANLGYKPAGDRIASFTTSDKAPIASAALSAMYRLNGDESAIPKVMGYLQSTNVNARRGSIQDLIDASYYRAIPHIARCPVSSVFRLRGIRLLAKVGIDEGKLTFAQVQPILEKVIRDHPNDVALVHTYDQVPAVEKPTVENMVQELYGTDFGRCYLASKSLIETYPEEAPAALFKSYEAEGYNDYGAHYHIMRLFGWLKVSMAYDLLVSALNNKAPQFQKSRIAAAIALGELGDARAISELKTALAVPIWDLQYAALMALAALGEASDLAIEPKDWLVQEKLNAVLNAR
ncbi:MAG: phycocyanin operon protein Y, partial [Cyanobacteria bacterium J06553_1]